MQAHPSEPTTSGPVDLAALDAALQPLRRAAAWALRAERCPAFFEVNAGRCLSRALSLDLPTDAREPLLEIGRQLEGIDAVDATDQEGRLAHIHQQLWRLDSLLGLPLPARRRTKRARRFALLPVEREERPERGRRGKGKPAPEAAPPPPPEPESRREPSSYAWGDPEHTGADLSDLLEDASLVAALADAGVSTLADLLWLAPAGAEVIRPVHGAGRPLPEGVVAVGGRVRSRATVCSPDGTRRTEIVVVGAGPLTVTWRGGAPAWLIARLTPGEKVVLAGTHPTDEDVLLDPELVDDDNGKAVRCSYGIGIDDAVIREAIRCFLPELDRVRDPLPGSVRKRADLIGFAEALSAVHRLGPEHAAARRRLCYEEAFLFQLGAAFSRFDGARDRAIVQPALHLAGARLDSRTGAATTDGQQRAVEDVKRGLKNTTPMRRLLVGPAGAGRSRVALHAAATVAEGKAQAVFVAPDATSAEAIFLFAEPLLREVGVVARLVTGAPSRAQTDALRRGEVHAVFGTAELVDPAVEYRRLALVVAEERAPLGEALDLIAARKGARPHLVVHTYGGVNGSALLARYASFDVSSIEVEGWQDVQVEVLSAEARSAAYARAAEAVEARRQALVVFPQIRGVDALDLTEARQVIATLEASAFPGRRVALFHGALPREERHRLYSDWRHHRLDVLVATAAFEEGPAVPAVAVAVVEQADRIDPVRLARIRAHLARGPSSGRMLLVLGAEPDAAGESLARQFAQRPEATTAMEVDGDAPDFRWIDADRDLPMLLEAREYAMSTLRENPGLRRGEALHLARLVVSRWDEWTDAACPVPDQPSANRRRRRRNRKK